MASPSSTVHSHRRLMQDIEELCTKPYPNIQLHVHDEDLSKLCLILSPPGWIKMHLTIMELERFPLMPPEIVMNSTVNHPNVFGEYICASILNTAEGYTPAYTLKGIAIQLLSFFGSQNIQQSYGSIVNLDHYRTMTVQAQESSEQAPDTFRCERCNFKPEFDKPVKDVPGALYVDQTTPKSSRRSRRSKISTPQSSRDSTTSGSESLDVESDSLGPRGVDTTTHIDKLPNEILLTLLERIEDFEDLSNLARAWDRISRVIAEFDVMRQRELQCFVLKKTYHEVKLGVGVYASTNEIRSEFDLLSQDAYTNLQVRKSVHNVDFQWWLPLPISEGHWRQVKDDARQTLNRLKTRGPLKCFQPTAIQLLYQFMSEIVIKLNKVEIPRRPGVMQTCDWCISTLSHASDKAIESYFHLFHLLVCLATEDNSVVREANRLLLGFQEGRRSKTHVPNLGHLLVAMLISDVQVTPELRKAIVTEAIVRNVVWMLRDLPQLAYRETDQVSAYRLDNTFKASRISYRLLMFSELFRRTARPNHQPLVQIRDELFRRHGGPPPGAASRVAAEVRRLHSVSDFPQFMREMGFHNVPSAANFSDFLRRTLDDSVKAGYSRKGIDQAGALALRLSYEGAVGIQPELLQKHECWLRVDGTLRRALKLPRVHIQGLNFFPERHRQAQNGTGGRGGRGGSWNRGGRR